MRPEEFLQMVLGLPEVTERESYGNMTGFRVRDKGFCYFDEAEGVVMLKATREEQVALVAEDPDTFAPSWASGGRFAWVKAKLATVDPDELNELVTEAWRLTAPKRLAATFRA